MNSGGAVRAESRGLHGRSVVILGKAGDSGHLYFRYAQDSGEADGAKMKVISDSAKDKLVNAT